MAKNKSTSRKSRRVAQQQRQQRQRFLIIGMVIAGVIVIFGLGFIIRQSRSLDIESVADVTLPESLEPPPGADGKAWGPPDAPVLFEEFSDFQ